MENARSPLTLDYPNSFAPKLKVQKRLKEDLAIQHRDSLYEVLLGGWGGCGFQEMAIKGPVFFLLFGRV